jgi:hypothetical protein
MSSSVILFVVKLLTLLYEKTYLSKKKSFYRTLKWGHVIQDNDTQHDGLNCDIKA